MLIDTAFDFRSDASGRDPDTYSPTLRRYHRMLWSKALPGGEVFDLSDEVRGAYLHYKSSSRVFTLASDSVIQTFTRWKSLKHVTSKFSEKENEEFQRISYTIGGMLIFPAQKIDGRQTINGARGFNSAIRDRFDLTLECIRRHYLEESSPLADALRRYEFFFSMFETFKGYVDFFLLNDLVDDEMWVRFFLPFDGFISSAAPKNEDDFKEYRRLSIEFVEARNRRIMRSMVRGGL